MLKGAPRKVYTNRYYHALHISNLLPKIDDPHKNLKVMTSKIGLEMRQKILCMNPEGFELVKIKNIASELYQNQHLAQSPVQKLHSLSIFWPNESLCL